MFQYWKRRLSSYQSFLCIYTPVIDEKRERKRTTAPDMVNKRKRKKTVSAPKSEKDLQLNGIFHWQFFHFLPYHENWDVTSRVVYCVLHCVIFAHGERSYIKFQRKISKEWRQSRHLRCFCVLLSFWRKTCENSVIRDTQSDKCVAGHRLHYVAFSNVRVRLQCS